MREVYVIGGANIDIIGRSAKKIIDCDSNIGTVVQSYGGVGRNIAENIARLGFPVHFVSVFGDDYNGMNCMKYCMKCGIDMSDCQIIENERSSSYLAVLDETGDMIVGINDMGILKHLNQDHIANVFKKIKKDDILVIDTNLEKDLIEWMMKHAPCDVYVDPISCGKAVKLKHLLSYIHTFKPNVLEAEYVSGIAYKDDASIDQMGQYFLDQGMQEVYISLGKDGVRGFKKDTTVTCSTETIQVVNATGAGDALMGGIVAGSLLGYDFIDKIQFAQSASVCTIETASSVCEELSIDFINQRKNKIQFQVKEKKRCI